MSYLKCSMDLGVCKNKTVDSLFELAKVGGVTALEKYNNEVRGFKR